MCNIWKIDTKYNINNYQNVSDICICSYCVAYLSDKNKLKTIIIPNTSENLEQYYKTKTQDSCISLYTKPEPYVKCYICERFIIDIINGPNILKLLSDHFNSNNCSTDLLMVLNKVSVWYYHHPFDYFGHAIRTKFKLNKQQIKNIYQAIKELRGLPNLDIIDLKASELYNYIKYGIIANAVFYNNLK